MSGDRQSSAEAELVEFADQRLDVELINLVRHQQHTPVILPQQAGDFLVERRDTFAHINHKQDQRRLGDGVANLLPDVIGEVVVVLDAESAGIDQLEIHVIDVAHRADPVARYTGRGIDDPDHPPRNTIEQRTLADVRPAYNGNNRQTHGIVTSNE